jgi:uncharacterized protein (DUF433 family)
MFPGWKYTSMSGVRLVTGFWVECRGCGQDCRINLRLRPPCRGRIIVGMKQSLLSRITIEAEKCGGRPCIRGQRMRVSDVLELLGAGASIEEILRDYAFLEREDILAAIAYAAQQTDHVIVQTA